MPKQTHRREVVRDDKGNRHFVSPMRDWKDVLWTRQAGRCWICGGLMVRKSMRNADGSHDAMHATIDHLIPQNQGGSDEVSNLALAHYSCNCLRGRNNLMPLGARLNTAEVLVFNMAQTIAAKDAEITVLITAHDAAIAANNNTCQQLETAARMHKFICKQRDRAQGQRDKVQENYTRLHSMIKPAAPCWWCKTRANFHRLIARLRGTSGL